MQRGNYTPRYEIAETQDRRKWIQLNDSNCALVFLKTTAAFAYFFLVFAHPSPPYVPDDFGSTSFCACVVPASVVDSPSCTRIVGRTCVFLETVARMRKALVILDTPRENWLGFLVFFCASSSSDSRANAFSNRARNRLRTCWIEKGAVRKIEHQQLPIFTR